MRESDRTPGPRPEDLEAAILGQVPAFNANEVAERTGASVEEARRLWRALGFPEHGLETAFTGADADALSTLLGMVGAGLIDFYMAVNLTRALGYRRSGLADWEIAS